MQFDNEDYITSHTQPYNLLNLYLHEHWEPYARKYGLKAYFKDGPEYRNAALCFRFSCSIPNERVLDAIACFGPVLEIGAGSGYWAYLLKNKGVDIVSVDNRVLETCWFPEVIIQDGLIYLMNNAGCANRSLMLCWPTCSFEILKAYRGNLLILIPNPDPAFRSGFNNMECFKEWQLIRRIDLPFWPKNNDVCLIYRRYETEN